MVIPYIYSTCWHIKLMFYEHQQLWGLLSHVRRCIIVVRILHTTRQKFRSMKTCAVNTARTLLWVGPHRTSSLTTREWSCTSLAADCISRRVTQLGHRSNLGFLGMKWLDLGFLERCTFLFGSITLVVVGCWGTVWIFWSHRESSWAMRGHQAGPARFWHTWKKAVGRFLFEKFCAMACVLWIKVGPNRFFGLNLSRASALIGWGFGLGRTILRAAFCFGSRSIFFIFFALSDDELSFQLVRAHFPLRATHTLCFLLGYSPV
jgi:hypothetical protein